jgi:hypothetical protein
MLEACCFVACRPSQIIGKFKRMALPYIPSKMLKRVALCMLFGGVLTVTGVLMAYHYSGKVVASAGLSQPIDTASVAEQFGAMMGEKVMRNAMVGADMPSVDVDVIEWISVNFNPVYLTPDMGEVALNLEISAYGTSAKRSKSDGNPTQGQKLYELVDKATGEVVWREETKRRLTSSNSVHIGMDHTGKETVMSTARTTKNSVIGRLSVTKAGEYVLRGRIEKLRYADPITDMKLNVKVGQQEQPDIKLMLSLAAIIVLGAVLFTMTTPPELRQKKKV